MNLPGPGCGVVIVVPVRLMVFWWQWGVLVLLAHVVPRSLLGPDGCFRVSGFASCSLAYFDNKGCSLPGRLFWVSMMWLFGR